MRQVLGVLPPLSFLLFGIVMAYGSITMEASFSGTNEHRWVPLGMSCAVCLLSAFLLGRQLLGIDNSDAQIAPRLFWIVVVPCTALLAAYAQASLWFGYPVATFASGVLVFLLFRNSLISSVIQSAVATLALYVIFFKLLKLYAPTGTVFDVQLPF